MSYTVPAGTSLPSILAQQYNDAAGIETRQNPNGTFELTAWPAGLGSQPTQLQITNWGNSQLTAQPDTEATRVLTENKMLRAFAIALKNQIPTLNLATLLADVKTAYKAL